MNSLNPKIFISYCSKDNQIVNDICKIFKSKSISYIVDYEKFSSENGVPREIREKIDISTHFLVILSENSLASSWVKYEIEYAENLAINGKLKLLAFKIDNFAIEEEIEKILIKAIIEPINTDNISSGVNAFLTKNPQIFNKMGREGHLLRSQIHILDVNEDDYDSERELLWLIVPRKKITVIHLAQIELIKYLLRAFNWSLTIVYINLRSKDNGLNTSKDNKKFDQLIKNQLKKKGVGDKCRDTFYLTDFFNLDTGSNNKGVTDLLLEFASVARKMSINTVLEIFHKQYSEVIRKEQLGKEFINLLRPFISIVFAKFFVQERDNVIFIAGADEISQWQYLINDLELSCGVMLIPTLEMDDKNDTKQDAKTTQYNSVENLIEYFGKGNNFYWVLSMFILLPNFQRENVNTPTIITQLLNVTPEELEELKIKGKDSNLHKKYQPNFREIASFIFPKIASPKN